MGFFQSPKPGLIDHLGLRALPLQTMEAFPEADRAFHHLQEVAIDVEAPAQDAGEHGSPQAKMLALYDEYRPRLLRYLASLQLTRDQAEEVVQETFLRLTAELAHGKDIQNVQGWIVRVSHNLAIDLRRRNERDAMTNMDLETVELQQPLVDPHADPYENYANEERMSRMESTLQTLNAQQRQCFHMRVQGFRFKDMAAALGISEQRAALVVKQVAVRLAAACK